MHLEDLEPDHLRQIIALYEKYLGDKGTVESRFLDHPMNVLNYLRANSTGTYRIGSKYSDSSKLLFRVNNGDLVISADPQCSSTDLFEASDLARQNFELEVSAYLGRLSKHSRR